MKFAAIDLGTNSFHLIIVERDHRLSFRVIDQKKEMIRIGSGMQERMLTEESMLEGIRVLKRFKKLAHLRKVDTQHIMAFATSAIRESKNGRSYIQRIKEETGIRANIISGKKEAKLIYLAVRRAIDISEKKALMIDVGGGSVEFVIGDSETIFFSESKKLGVSRLTDSFVRSDPISKKTISQLEKHVEKELSQIVETAKYENFDIAIASSGTAQTIARMIRADGNSNFSGSLNGYSFSYDQLSMLNKKIIHADSTRRRKLKGLDEKREDIISAGVVLFKKMFELFDIRTLTISESALREGIVIDYFLRDLSTFKYNSERRRSVVRLAERCHYKRERALHVAKLALMLFDESQRFHRLPRAKRELLEYSAILQNVGYFISISAHHKHSHYIIMNAELYGFTRSEIRIMANSARYHRKSEPKKAHLDFQNLSELEKKSVCIFGGMLRIANALDRTHRQAVKNLRILENTAENITIQVVSLLDAEIEIWESNTMKGMLECALSKKIQVVNK